MLAVIVAQSVYIGRLMVFVAQYNRHPGINGGDVKC